MIENITFQMLDPESCDDVITVVLTPGEEKCFSGGGPDEEGFHFWTERLTYDADEGAVYRVEFSDGTDCDGRLTRTHKTRCLVSELATYPCKVDGKEYKFPNWEHVTSGQRDYAAEAMNY